jgi:hypothetical protein
MPQHRGREGKLLRHTDDVAKMLEHCIDTHQHKYISVGRRAAASCERSVSI